MISKQPNSHDVRVRLWVDPIFLNLVPGSAWAYTNPDKIRMYMLLLQVHKNINKRERVQ
jgi:hypothetical protein